MGVGVGVRVGGTVMRGGRGGGGGGGGEGGGNRVNIMIQRLREKIVSGGKKTRI